MYVNSGAKIVELPFIMKLGMSSGPADLEGLRNFIAFGISDSDIAGRCKRSLLSDSQ
jgi:hypothetical protein